MKLRNLKLILWNLIVIISLYSLISTSYAISQSQTNNPGVNSILYEARDYVENIDSDYDKPPYIIDINTGKAEITFSWFLKIWNNEYTLIIDPSQMNNREVLYHEYGHHLIHQVYDKYGPISRTPTDWLFGVGKFPYCQADSSNPEGHDFDRPMYCDSSAFNEGWAHTFSSAVRDNSTNAKISIENTSIKDLVSDVDLNEPPLKFELTTAKILWGIIDDPNSIDGTPDEDDDEIYNEFGKVWTILKEDQPVDILEFFVDWMDKGETYRIYSNELYAIYQDALIFSKDIGEVTPYFLAYDKSAEPGFGNPWEFFCHDQRRTCFSSLTGDIDSEEKSMQFTWKSPMAGDTDSIVMADIDGDGDDDGKDESEVYSL